MSLQRIDRKIEYSVKQRVIMSDFICDNNNSESPTRGTSYRAHRCGKKKEEMRTVTFRGRSRFSAARMRLLHVHASCATGGTAASFAWRKERARVACKQVINVSRLRACVRAWRPLMGHVGTSMRGIVLVKSRTGIKATRALEYRKFRN